MCLDRVLRSSCYHFNQLKCSLSTRCFKGICTESTCMSANSLYGMHSIPCIFILSCISIFFTWFLQNVFNGNLPTTLFIKNIIEIKQISFILSYITKHILCTRCTSLFVPEYSYFRCQYQILHHSCFKVSKNGEMSMKEICFISLILLRKWVFISRPCKNNVEYALNRPTSMPDVSELSQSVLWGP